MSSMPNIKNVVEEIMTEAMQRVGETLINRAHSVNGLFDDARGCIVGGKYISSLECTAEGLRQLDDLLAYADEAMGTVDSATWECVRDALGSVHLWKAPLPEEVVKEYDKRIKRYVSPTFGDHPRCYVVTTNFGVIRAENDESFKAELKKGTFLAAELDTLGAEYYWDRKLSRWVVDCLINPDIRPCLKKYM